MQKYYNNNQKCHNEHEFVRFVLHHVCAAPCKDDKRVYSKMKNAYRQHIYSKIFPKMHIFSDKIPNNVSDERGGEPDNENRHKLHFTDIDEICGRKKNSLTKNDKAKKQKNILILNK